MPKKCIEDLESLEHLEETEMKKTKKPKVIKHIEEPVVADIPDETDDDGFCMMVSPSFRET